MSDNARLQREIEFTLEIDGLKQVLRQTCTTARPRQENSAERARKICSGRKCGRCQVKDLYDRTKGITFKGNIAIWRTLDQMKHAHR